MSKPQGMRNYSVPKTVMNGGHRITGCMRGCTILLEEPTFLLASLTCHSEVTVFEKKIPYIEGFVPRINTSPKPTIFTHNTTVTLYSKTFNDFCSVIHLVPSHMNNSFTANKLFLNLRITYIQVDFMT